MSDMIIVYIILAISFYSLGLHTAGTLRKEKHDRNTEVGKDE